MQLLDADCVQALLIIEIQDAATWDFGPVEWRNILVVANTTSTDWCR
jgi:hypothetical protein